MINEIWSDLRYRVRALLHRERLEHDLDDELGFHVEREVDKYVRSGMPRAEAERRARLAFGGVDRIKDDTRDSHGLAVLDIVAHDVRYALRSLRLTPGFTTAIVLTLALGIGATAAMFGVVDRLMFRPPAYLRDPASVNRVYLAATFRGERGTFHHFEYKRYRDFIAWTSSSVDVAAFATNSMAVGPASDAREIIVGIATASFFDFFDARPEVGRFYTHQEDTVSPGPLVAVISHALWQTQFGGRRDAIGEVIDIGPRHYTIIGVAPDGFAGLDVGAPPAAWIPLTPYASSHKGFDTDYDWGWLGMVVRRKAGVSIATSSADFTTAYERSWLAERETAPAMSPVSVAHPAVILAPVQIERGPEAGAAGRVVTWVAGVAIIALLVACANVANLLLARAFRRRREIAIRLAMGVTRGRLIAQLVTESLTLAILGGGAGLLVGWWGGTLLERMFQPDHAATPSIADPRTMAFCTAATLVVGLLTGIAPVLQATRGDLISSLKAGVREGGAHRSKLRTLLVVSQGALCVVLLVGAGLFVRSLAHVHALPLGYDVDPILVVHRNMRGGKLAPEASRALQHRLVHAAQSTPGVEGATEMVSTPFYDYESTYLKVPGVDSVRRLGPFQLQYASPGYFRTVGTRIVAGRGITANDRSGAPLVIVVSTEMARRLWPGRSALGQCVHVGADSMPCSTVVGIAEDIKERKMSLKAEANYYLPVEQVESHDIGGLYVRVRGNARDQADAVRRSLQTVMPGASYVSVMPFADIIDGERRSWRLGAMMFAALGGLSLVLASIGLYSVIAYGVAQRTHELGVRIALGAQVRDVLGLILGEGFRLALYGLAIGTGLSLIASRGIASLLFNESPRDPAVFAVVGGVLLGVGLVACLVPALRATRVDPNVALRSD
ncbi:MAG: ADOP family duplicated permease [bacterium]